MNAKNERNSKAPKPANDPAAPRKRFRIEKLEERIAPSRGGKGTHNCSTIYHSRSFGPTN
jgi:hypothetical protein